LGRTYLANSVKLGTRVRTEILRAMVKCFASVKETMFVTAFASRPLLHLRPKESSCRVMAYRLVDAMSRYGQQMRQANLGEAYRRAGVPFKDQLQQKNVLHKSCPPVFTPWVRGQLSAEARSKRKLAGEGGGSGTPEKVGRNLLWLVVACV
jgi:hypothetical protein